MHDASSDCCVVSLRMNKCIAPLNCHGLSWGRNQQVASPHGLFDVSMFVSKCSFRVCILLTQLCFFSFLLSILIRAMCLNGISWCFSEVWAIEWQRDRVGR